MFTHYGQSVSAAPWGLGSHPVTPRDACEPNKSVAYSYVMPTKSDPGEIGDVEPLADHTASQARRVVAAYANDADECRVFLSMLGIGPAKHDT